MLTNVSYIGNLLLPTNLIFNGYISNLNNINTSSLVNSNIIDGWSFKSLFSTASISATVSNTVTITINTIESTVNNVNDYIILNWQVSSKDLPTLQNKNFRLILNMSSTIVTDAMVVLSNFDNSKYYQKQIQIGNINKQIIDITSEGSIWNNTLDPGMNISLVLKSPYVDIWTNENKVIPINPLSWFTEPDSTSEYTTDGTNVYYITRLSELVNEPKKLYIYNGITWAEKIIWSNPGEPLRSHKLLPLVGINGDIYLLLYGSVDTRLYWMNASVPTPIIVLRQTGTIVDKQTENGRVVYNQLNSLSYIFGSSTMWKTYSFDASVVNGLLTEITTNGTTPSMDNYNIAIQNNIVYLYSANQLFTFDTTTNTYNDISLLMKNTGPTTTHSSMEVIGDKLFLYGGLDNLTLSNAFNIYDLTKNIWYRGNSNNSPGNRVRPVIFNQSNKLFVAGGGIHDTYSCSTIDIINYSSFESWKNTTPGSAKYIQSFNSDNFKFYENLNSIEITSIGLYDNNLRDENTIDQINISKTKSISTNIVSENNDYIVAKGHASSNTNLKLYGKTPLLYKPGTMNITGTDIGSGLPSGIEIINSSGSGVPIYATDNISFILQDKNSFGIDITTITPQFIADNPYSMVIRANTNSMVKLKSNI